jgi:hypothetical protein
MAHVDPTAAVFIVDFPEFETQDPARIDRMIAVAKRMVDTSWTEGDYTRAIELYAAHMLVASDAAIASGGAGGVIASESLGGLSVSYEKGGSQLDAADLVSSSYGREFMLLARLNRGGPRSF